MSIPTSPAYSEPREVWDIHAGFYRPIGSDLSQTWQPSPEVTNPPLPLLSPLKPVFELPRHTSLPSGSGSTTSHTLAIDVPTAYPKEKLGLWARIRRFIKSGPNSSVVTEKVKVPVYQPSPSPFPSAENRVNPNEWKAYGYWALPLINGVECPNSPFISEESISSPDLEQMITSLRDSNGRQHKDKWKPGVRHPALPPRPARWKRPQVGQPLPFPWEVQVNPMLQHHIWGPAPLSWCLCAKPQNMVFHGRATNGVPVNNADFAQPATYPFLTHMHFNAVAGDSAPAFPWPFTVVNERGIKVRDVLEEIWRIFQARVAEEEHLSWPPLRREMAAWALEKRCQVLSEPGRPYRDFLRRCDSFGGIMFFRGIEPTADGCGWMISFGNH
ncbi:hypothetical protein CPB83DRAFT_807418 [Crepidotus variabilis]|uniref:DUF6699 domain-containing protein n=1 Tax=Crepidotus variabilis TaxID=179855 RepID=A0A9P6JTD3_9AGAR|nr:hypothetical protein CPB83DRAFT_807418 [Crepidotus variabilis]